jgi:hypothetical protein
MHIEKYELKAGERLEVFEFTSIVSLRATTYCDSVMGLRYLPA